MAIVLIDTDVASFLFKDSNYAEPYIPLLDDNKLALSFMSIAELFQWAMVQQWGDRRLTQLEESFGNYITIPVDHLLCKSWAQVRASRKRTGRPISPQDAWIAATALRYDLPPITHNAKDFIGTLNLRLMAPEA